MSLLRNFFSRTKFKLSLRAAARRSAIFLSAGMPRSGSTWLFNAARLLLQTQGELSSGWIGDWASLPKKGRFLLKVHDYDPFLARHARTILYSYRDLRDVLASSKRKFGIEPTLDQARRWVTADRHWRERAAFILKYESMLAEPVQTIRELAQVLAILSSDPEQVFGQLNQFDSPHTGAASYDRETLLHPGHCTDGRHGTWYAWLDPGFVRQLEHEFCAWFEKNGYAVGDG